MTGQAAAVIDGKYQVVRELAREGHVTLSEVRAGEGATRRVAWFDVATPTARQGFHAYRAALRAIAPAGLTDVVARPGAYYAVWQPVAGTPLSEVAAQPRKQEEVVAGAVQALATKLAEHGYALPDADVVVDGRDVRVAYLRPAPEGRTSEEVARLNEGALAPFSGGRVQRRRQPGAWLTFVPGLFFLGGAVYLGGLATQVYLNPPVHPVMTVTGQPAQQAAQNLTAAGFQVEYAKGDAAGVPIGAVIRQDPAAGTTLPVGRPVTLTVNNPPSLSVPRLEELTLDQARASLRDSALTLGKVVRADGSLTKTPEGRIIAQVPEAGADLQRGQPVQVLVSSGIRGKETFLANLTGMTYQAARKNAQVAGLVVTRVVQQPSDAPENTVLEQTPAPYVRVPVGSPVTLTVAAARVSPPSQPAGSLPLPPPPQDQSGQDQTSPPQGSPSPGSGPASPEAPGTLPDQTPLAPQNTPATPDTESAPPSTDTAAPEAAPRAVHFRYQFPADLPAGTYTISVRDADGEREIQGNTDSSQLAGMLAEGDPVVRGDATFIIRRGGAEYATVKP